MTPIPGALRVYGTSYPVIPDDTLRARGNLGEFTPGASIAYDPAQPPLEVASTFLHEAFHAVRHGQGRYYAGKVEEDYVNSLAVGLVALIRDNPELGPWLASLHND